MYIFNIFNECKGNDDITTIMIWLDVNPCFFLENIDF